MAHRNRVNDGRNDCVLRARTKSTLPIANNASAAVVFSAGNIDPVLSGIVAGHGRQSRAGEVIREFEVWCQGASVQTLLDLNFVITDTVRLVSSMSSIEKRDHDRAGSHLPQVKAALVQIQKVLLNLIIKRARRGGDCPAERRIIVSTVPTRRCGRNKRA